MGDSTGFEVPPIPVIDGCRNDCHGDVVELFAGFDAVVGVRAPASEEDVNGDAEGGGNGGL